MSPRPRVMSRSVLRALLVLLPLAGLLPWTAAQTCQPSWESTFGARTAIDGNVWADYDAFATALLDVAPGAALMLDLTYVGCVAKPFTVKADYPNIETIFFSCLALDSSNRVTPM